MAVTVMWGDQSFHFDLPSPDTTLAAVKHSIAAYTQLPYNAFLLIHDGAVMEDDNAPIDAYHLRPNSTIAIVTRDNAAHLTTTNNDEAAQIAKIQSELASVQNTLVPAHAQFMHTQSLHSSPKEKSRLSELLLQALIRMDAIVPEKDWVDARAQRKAAVRTIQELLDQLDSLQ
ncbi:hypothetical protein CPB83DRAFT_852880 [Crepidotus variabilis]|uniref:BAG domain-containing protein n=1 Tax=Crepidotus variabilis TaxID=179855 RepID=A0A9P6JR57_9AGAR|nr:hypothetical protein CPB83DRAFT_852880 [Crepidotus variabilis]